MTALPAADHPVAFGGRIVSSHNYAIRDAAGRLHAVHVRRETPTGKAMSWRGVDGRPGLNGRRVDTLPLYGSERVPTWPLDAWVIVCEGESDTDALLALRVPALGTVTGATVGTDSVTAPTVDALRDIATGRRFVTWGDNDDVGRAHAAAVAANLYRAGAVDVRAIVYRPTAVPWPKGAGARDLISTADPMSGAFMVSWLLEEWSVPVGRPGPMVTIDAPRRSYVPRDSGSVSDALLALGVVNARPGRTVRCPRHEDMHASLSILRDDRRAICKSASCEWAGRGAWAPDIAAMVTA